MNIWIEQQLTKKRNNKTFSTISNEFVDKCYNFVLNGLCMLICWRILWRLSTTIRHTIPDPGHNIQTIKVETRIESQFIFILSHTWHNCVKIPRIFSFVFMSWEKCPRCNASVLYLITFFITFSSWQMFHPSIIRTYSSGQFYLSSTNDTSSVSNNISWI